MSRAHHSSATCQLHLATDHGDGMRPVALKFMKHRDQFAREVEVRTKGQLDGAYVVSVLRCHDPDADVDYAVEVQRKGLSKYPYLVVMDAGERNLADVLNKVHIRDLLHTVCLPFACVLLTLPLFTYDCQLPQFLSLTSFVETGEHRGAGLGHDPHVRLAGGPLPVAYARPRVRPRRRQAAEHHAHGPRVQAHRPRRLRVIRRRGLRLRQVFERFRLPGMHLRGRRQWRRVRAVPAVPGHGRGRRRLSLHGTRRP